MIAACTRDQGLGGEDLTPYLNDSSLQDKRQEGVQERGVVDADGGEEGHVDVGQEPEEEEDEDDGGSQQGDVAAVDPYAVISHRSLQEHHDEGPAAALVLNPVSRLSLPLSFPLSLLSISRTVCSMVDAHGVLACM